MEKPQNTNEIEKNLQKVIQKRNFYTLRDSSIVYFLAIVVPLLFGILFSYLAVFIATKTGTTFPEGSNPIRELFNNNLGFAIPYSLLVQVVFVCLYFCWNKANRVKFSSCGLSFKKAKPSTAFLSILFGMIFVFGFIWLIEGCFGDLFDIFKLNTPPEDLLMLPLNSLPWLFANILILGIVPAICEELIFRGVIFKGLKSAFSSTISIFICALLFALIHQDITQFIYPFLLGSVLCLVMDRTGNLLYPILIHMFNNITTVILSYLSNVGLLDLSFSFLSANGGLVFVSWLCATLVAYFAILLFWLWDKFHLSKQVKLEDEKEGENFASSQKMVGKIPLIMVAGMVLTLIMIVINAL